MRRRRSTRAELIRREAEQAIVVAELMRVGADGIAAQLLRCWHDRLFGDPARHRFRCRSVSCGSCRRTSLNGWFRAFRRWADEGGLTSYFRIPVNDPLIELPVIGKSLRNLRDRLARDSWLYARVAFLGVADDSHVHLIVSHPGLNRRQIAERLHALWPEMVLEDAPADPVDELSPQVARPARSTVPRATASALHHLAARQLIADSAAQSLARRRVGSTTAAQQIVVDRAPRRSLGLVAAARDSLTARSLVPSDMKSRLYQSAVAEARRLLGKRITPSNVVEHLLHDNRFHVLFPSHDGRSIGEDCRDCAEEPRR